MEEGVNTLEDVGVSLDVKVEKVDEVEEDGVVSDSVRGMVLDGVDEDSGVSEVVCDDDVKIGELEVVSDDVVGSSDVRVRVLDNEGDTILVSDDGADMIEDCVGEVEEMNVLVEDVIEDGVEDGGVDEDINEDVNEKMDVSVMEEEVVADEDISGLFWDEEGVDIIVWSVDDVAKDDDAKVGVRELNVASDRVSDTDVDTGVVVELAKSVSARLIWY